MKHSGPLRTLAKLVCIVLLCHTVWCRTKILSQATIHTKKPSLQHPGHLFSWLFLMLYLIYLIEMLTRT